MINHSLSESTKETLENLNDIIADVYLVGDYPAKLKGLKNLMKN